jgi:hypothetical protein
LEASFLKEMGSHTLFQRGSRRKGFWGWSGVVGFSHFLWIHWLSQVNWFGLHLYEGRGNNLESIYYVRPNRNIRRSIKRCLLRAAYLRIQILQNPVTLKKALSCFMVWGSGKRRIGSIPS